MSVKALLLLLVGCWSIQWKAIKEFKNNLEEYLVASLNTTSAIKNILEVSRANTEYFVTNQFSNNFVKRIIIIQSSNDICYTRFINKNNIKTSFINHVLRLQIPLRRRLNEIRLRLNKIISSIKIYEKLAKRIFQGCKSRRRYCMNETNEWLRSTLRFLSCLIYPNCQNMEIQPNSSIKIRTDCPTCQFNCKYGKCIINNSFCNGLCYCVNSSTEPFDGIRNCSKFRCIENLFCVLNSRKCNGYGDGGDGKDGKRCKSCYMMGRRSQYVNCAIVVRKFLCQYTMSIGLRKVCDSKNGCEETTNESIYCRVGDCPLKYIKRCWFCTSKHKNSECVIECPLKNYEISNGCNFKPGVPLTSLIQFIEDTPRLIFRYLAKLTFLKNKTIEIIYQSFRRVLQCKKSKYSLLHVTINALNRNVHIDHRENKTENDTHNKEIFQKSRKRNYTKEARAIMAEDNYFIGQTEESTETQEMIVTKRNKVVTTIKTTPKRRTTEIMRTPILKKKKNTKSKATSMIRKTKKTPQNKTTPKIRIKQSIIPTTTRKLIISYSKAYFATKKKEKTDTTGNQKTKITEKKQLKNSLMVISHKPFQSPSRRIRGKKVTQDLFFGGKSENSNETIEDNKKDGILPLKSITRTATIHPITIVVHKNITEVLTSKKLEIISKITASTVRTSNNIPANKTIFPDPLYITPTTKIAEIPKAPKNSNSNTALPKAKYVILKTDMSNTPKMILSITKSSATEIRPSSFISKKNTMGILNVITVTSPNQNITMGKADMPTINWKVNTPDKPFFSQSSIIRGKKVTQDPFFGGKIDYSIETIEDNKQNRINPVSKKTELPLKHSTIIATHKNITKVLTSKKLEIVTKTIPSNLRTSKYTPATTSISFDTLYIIPTNKFATILKTNQKYTKLNTNYSTTNEETILWKFDTPRTTKITPGNTITTSMKLRPSSFPSIKDKMGISITLSQNTKMISSDKSIIKLKINSTSHKLLASSKSGVGGMKGTEDRFFGGKRVNGIQILEDHKQDNISLLTWKKETKPKHPTIIASEKNLSNVFTSKKIEKISKTSTITVKKSKNISAPKTISATTLHINPKTTFVTIPTTDNPPKTFNNNIFIIDERTAKLKINMPTTTKTIPRNTISRNKQIKSSSLISIKDEVGMFIVITMTSTNQNTRMSETDKSAIMFITNKISHVRFQSHSSITRGKKLTQVPFFGGKSDFSIETIEDNKQNRINPVASNIQIPSKLSTSIAKHRTITKDLASNKLMIIPKTATLTVKTNLTISATKIIFDTTLYITATTTFEKILKINKKYTTLNTNNSTNKEETIIGKFDTPKSTKIIPRNTKTTSMKLRPISLTYTKKKIGISIVKPMITTNQNTTMINSDNPTIKLKINTTFHNPFQSSTSCVGRLNVTQNSFFGRKSDDIIEDHKQGQTETTSKHPIIIATCRNITTVLTSKKLQKIPKTTALTARSGKNNSKMISTNTFYITSTSKLVTILKTNKTKNTKGTIHLLTKFATTLKIDETRMTFNITNNSAADKYSTIVEMITPMCSKISVCNNKSTTIQLSNLVLTSTNANVGISNTIIISSRILKTTVYNEKPTREIHKLLRFPTSDIRGNVLIHNSFSIMKSDESFANTEVIEQNNITPAISKTKTVSKQVTILVEQRNTTKVMTSKKFVLISNLPSSTVKTSKNIPAIKTTRATTLNMTPTTIFTNSLKTNIALNNFNANDESFIKVKTVIVLIDTPTTAKMIHLNTKVIEADTSKIIRITINNLTILTTLTCKDTYNDIKFLNTLGIITRPDPRKSAMLSCVFITRTSFTPTYNKIVISTETIPNIEKKNQSDKSIALFSKNTESSKTIQTSMYKIPNEIILADIVTKNEYEKHTKIVETIEAEFTPQFLMTTEMRVNIKNITKMGATLAILSNTIFSKIKITKINSTIILKIPQITHKWTTPLLVENIQSMNKRTLNTIKKGSTTVSSPDRSYIVTSSNKAIADTFIKSSTFIKTNVRTRKPHTTINKERAIPAHFIINETTTTLFQDNITARTTIKITYVLEKIPNNYTTIKPAPITATTDMTKPEKLSTITNPSKIIFTMTKKLSTFTKIKDKLFIISTSMSAKIITISITTAKISVTKITLTTTIKPMTSIISIIPVVATAFTTCINLLTSITHLKITATTLTSETLTAITISIRKENEIPIIMLTTHRASPRSETINTTKISSTMEKNAIVRTIPKATLKHSRFIPTAAISSILKVFQSTTSVIHPSKKTARNKKCITHPREKKSKKYRQGNIYRRFSRRNKFKNSAPRTAANEFTKHCLMKHATVGSRFHPLRQFEF